MTQDRYQLIHGDCQEILPTFPSGSVDVVLTDPPYPCIKRQYGYWTEEEWFAMMRRVVPECMRTLKPSGSAVFILQPNSERVGRMRTWLWEFMLWVGKEWGIVQDAWWWNHTTSPTGCTITGDLLRPSVKACVWVGQHNCYRDSSGCLWDESEGNAAMRQNARFERKYRPSGHTMNKAACAAVAVKRGGVTPFNLLPVANSNSATSAGANGHGAGTPAALCDWWLRYLCPPGGTVLDPFVGSGTVAMAAKDQGKRAIGIERDADYFAMAQRRLSNTEPGFSFAEVAP